MGPPTQNVLKLHAHKPMMPCMRLLDGAASPTPVASSNDQGEHGGLGVGCRGQADKGA